MKTPEEYNEIYFRDDNLDLTDLIREIQTEAWNAAIDAAAENVIIYYDSKINGTWKVDKQSILKLKK